MHPPHLLAGHHLGWPYLVGLISLLLVASCLLAPAVHPLDRRESSLAALLFWLLLPLALVRYLIYKFFNH